MYIERIVLEEWGDEGGRIEVPGVPGGLGKPVGRKGSTRDDEPEEARA